MRMFLKLFFFYTQGIYQNLTFLRSIFEEKKRLYKLILKKEKTVIEWGMDNDNKFFKQGIKTYIFPIQ